MTDDYDPCPAGHEGVEDLGHGVRIRFTTYQGVRHGLIESHDRPDGGGRCSGAITFAGAPTPQPDRPAWTVESQEPLTLSPSLLCRTCGHHGFIRDGRWVPA